MLNQQQPDSINRTVSHSAPIDPQPLIEHGTEPVSIILAIAILLSIVIGSITRLVQVILILRQPRTSR